MKVCHLLHWVILTRRKNTGTAQAEQIVSFGMVISYNAIKTGNSTTSFISIFHDVTFQFQDYHLEMDESPVTKDHNDWI